MNLAWQMLFSQTPPFIQKDATINVMDSFCCVAVVMVNIPVTTTTQPKKMKKNPYKRMRAVEVDVMT